MITRLVKNNKKEQIYPGKKSNAVNFALQYSTVEGFASTEGLYEYHGLKNYIG